MGQKIEALDATNKEYEYEGQVVSDGKVVQVYTDHRFTATGKRRQRCMSDLNVDLTGALLEDFWQGECVYPEPEQEQLIRYRVECNGPKFLGGCGLRIVQYDAEGNQIS